MSDQTRPTQFIPVTSLQEAPRPGATRPKVLVTSRIAASILTPSAKGGYTGTFDYSLNPYVGCGFGCSYCYAASPIYGLRRGHDGDWGTWVERKSNAVALLEREARRGRVTGKRIFMSTVTDPYQPEERRARITRGCLELLTEWRPSLLFVQTRSPLVTRDADLLGAMADNVLVSLSVTTNDEEVRRAFEPTCAPIIARIEALRELRAAGIRTRASIAPLLPCDPLELAVLLDDAVDQVVVSPPHAANGPGARTQTAALDIYKDRGWGEWLDPLRLSEVINVLRQLLGNDRVIEGRAGFNPADATAG